MTSSTTLGRTMTAGALLTALALPLTACGDDGSAATSSSTAGATSTSSTASPDAALTLEDGWVKAADEGMTAAFGTLRNDTGSDIVITGGTSPVAGAAETHIMETGDDGVMVMAEAPDGLTVPAGGTLSLDPGGAHLMLMDLAEEVRAGDDVEIVVSTRDEQEVTLTVPAREFEGAQESYDSGDDEMSDTSDMSSSS